jgi:hypothetical protein
VYQELVSGQISTTDETRVLFQRAIRIDPQQADFEWHYVISARIEAVATLAALRFFSD